jgi:hypothetical protein
MGTLFATSTNIKFDTQTLEQCVKQISHFGSIEFVNICTGQTNIVQWGGLDWFVVLGLIALVGGTALAFLALIFSMKSDF